MLCILVLAITLFFVGQLWVTVPWVPTPQPIVDAMVRAANLRGTETVYDLGAGDARFLIAVKRQFPSVHAVGYEMSPLIWLLGRLRIWHAGADVRLIFGDAFKADLRDGDRIFLYLFPHIMTLLQSKFDRELRPGTRVLSFGFRFPTKELSETVSLSDLGDKRSVFVYEW